MDNNFITRSHRFYSFLVVCVFFFKYQLLPNRIAQLSDKYFSKIPFEIVCSYASLKKKKNVTVSAFQDRMLNQKFHMIFLNVLPSVYVFFLNNPKYSPLYILMGYPQKRLKNSLFCCARTLKSKFNHHLLRSTHE